MDLAALAATVLVGLLAAWLAGLVITDEGIGWSGTWSSDSPGAARRRDVLGTDRRVSD